MFQILLKKLCSENSRKPFMKDFHNNNPEVTSKKRENIILKMKQYG